MKRLSKIIGVVCGVSLCTMIFFSVNMSVYASDVTTIEESGETRSTNLGWVYKYFDGVLMMRLYNYSTGEWLTDWIPAVGEP